MLGTQAVAGQFALVCPMCRVALDAVTPDSTHCARCDREYANKSGIWRFLPEQRAKSFAQFEREYLTVRHAEGWGSNRADYYRALPLTDLSGRCSGVWRIRAATFRTLLRLLPDQPLRVLDLGAGNGWLAYQLARRQHDVVAVDVLVDEQDGLGAVKHYDAPFEAMQAEFDHLPLAPEQVDMAIFNGSLHYSTDTQATLREALRVLEPRGTIAILDSPMYPTTASGMQMVHEREARFLEKYGFASDSIPSEHFLTPRRLRELGEELGIDWRLKQPWRGLRSAVMPCWARVRGKRQPASFPVIVGTRT
jgi:SAM-dependent methyltransferase